MGTVEEKERIHAFQRRLLEQQDSLIPRFYAWFERHGLSLSLPAAPTFQDQVVAYEWDFWQRHAVEVADIPDASTPYDEWIDHLAAVVPLENISDQMREQFRPYAYQAYTQLGAPAIDVSHLDGLMLYEPLDVWTKYALPRELPLEYDPAAMFDVLHWLQTEGDRILLIYGELDPWTGGAIELTGPTNVLKLIQTGADHGVRLLDLDAKDLAITTLGGWLGLELSGVSTPAIRGPAPEPRTDLRLGPIWSYRP